MPVIYRHGTTFKKMDELIDYTLKIILRLAISEYFQYAAGSCIIVGVLALIYRLTGKRKFK